MIDFKTFNESGLFVRLHDQTDAPKIEGMIELFPADLLLRGLEKFERFLFVKDTPNYYPQFYGSLEGYSSSQYAIGFKLSEDDEIMQFNKFKKTVAPHQENQPYRRVNNSQTNKNFCEGKFLSASQFSLPWHADDLKALLSTVEKISAQIPFLYVAAMKTADVCVTVCAVSCDLQNLKDF